MKRYRQLVKELPSKSVVFAFGRFNPPTTGHELLFKVVKKLAASHNADHVIYASRTQDKKKNPLSVDRKIHYLKLMFKGLNFAAANNNERTFIEAAKSLNKKYKNIIMVAGSDRVAEYERILNTYNGKDFHFDTIQVVSAGERDPDADDASGMSASKMRAVALKGNYAEFKKGLPSTIRDIDGKLLMNEIRFNMGMAPIKEQVKFEVDEVREKYFNGEIYHVGEIVESNGNQYEIVDRGSNYLVVVDNGGNLHRKWITDVAPTQTIKEDIQPGPAPKEITYKGYTTKNLHHSADAAKAWQATIARAEKGLVENDPVAILNGIKATDAFMKLNDMHLEQGKKPDEKELQDWVAAHARAKQTLEKIGEFQHHMDYWRNHQTELQFMGANFGETGKGELQEALTNKTVKPQDKIKVARIIADMLGVSKAESQSNPDQLINMALRKLKTQQINPAMLNVVHKMLDLADQVQINYDKKLRPAKLQENKDNQVVVDPESGYNMANSIMRYSDYIKSKKMNKGQVTEQDHTQAAEIAAKKLEKQDAPHTTPGHALGHPDDDQLRRRKIRYATEEKKTAIVSPVKDDSIRLGAPTKNWGIFKEEEDEEHDIDDDELEAMANSVDHEDDIMDVYDDDELEVIDAETGEVVEEAAEFDMTPLNEVLSRTERMKAKARFARTKSKRERRTQIALKMRSSPKVINRRARKLAINLLKKRLTKKSPNKLSVSEKERVEKMLEKRKALINRLAVKLVPRVKGIESARLSHHKFTKSAPNAGI